MVMSKSAIKAQEILLCQLCKVDKRLKWKCLECQLLMCNKCDEKILPKIKTAKNHQVIDIKDIERYAHLNTEADFSNAKCRQHETQVCCLHCSSCEQLVCPKVIKVMTSLR